MIAVCGACCRKDTVDEHFARVREPRRAKRRGRVVEVGRWPTYGGV